MNFNKLKEHLKNPYTLTLIAILILALAIRLSYFNINQAVWWDEAEYLLQAKAWAFGTPNTGFGVVRPILLPFLLSFFYKLGGTEITSRIVILVFSMLSVYLSYLVGKQLFNKKVGLIAAFLLSIFYLELFHTIRVLVDTPGTTMILLTMYLFWKGYYHNRKYLYWFGLVFALGFMLRFTTGLFLIVILLYLLLTEHLRFLKVKELWISGIIALGAMTPYFIWSYKQYGHPLESILYSGGSAAQYSAEKGLSEAFNRLSSYLTQSPLYLKTVLLILVIIGLFSLYRLITNFDSIIKRKDKTLNPQLFIVLWILVPLIYFSFFFHVFDVRYLLATFPATFMIAGLGTLLLYNIIKKHNKALAVIIILIVLLFVGYQQTTFAKGVIEGRSNSFIQFKVAGEWLKERTTEDEVIFNTGVPQNVYYTERDTFGHDSEEFFENRRKNEKIRYFVLSKLELSPDWAYTYPDRNSDIMNLVYVCDNRICTDDTTQGINTQQLTLTIHKFKE
tara:strand:+ start:4351 stop:5862 length:1512 start_codon:yes stop_codon:yes gene_type:complete